MDRFNRTVEHHIMVAKLHLDAAEGGNEHLGCSAIVMSPFQSAIERLAMANKRLDRAQEMLKSPAGERLPN